jgi:hypothetical protein
MTRLPSDIEACYKAIREGIYNYEIESVNYHE